MGTRFSHSNVVQYNGGFCKILLTLNDLYFLIEKNPKRYDPLKFHFYPYSMFLVVYNLRNINFPKMHRTHVLGNALEGIFWRIFRGKSLKY